MTNSRSDVQRQFELLYHRISQIKHEFESCSNYDSSGNNTESEYDTDDGLEIDFKENTSFNTEERNDKKTGRRSNNKTQSDEKEIDESTNGLSETSHGSDSEKDIDDTSSAGGKSQTAIDDKLDETPNVTKPDTADRDSHCEGIRNLSNFRDFSQTKSDFLSVEDEFPSRQSNFTFEIPNANEQALNLASVRQNKTNYISDLIVQKCKHRTDVLNSKYAAFWTFNIRPRRPLHAKFPGQGVNIDKDEHIEGFTASVSDIDTNSSLEPLDARDIQTPTEYNDHHGGIDSDEENLNFISVEGGFISFTVKSDCDSLSTDSESELDFLHFEDGRVRFDVKSTGYSNTDFAYTYFEYSSEDDIFLSDETIGIEALFDDHLADECEDSLDGLEKLFDESLHSDNNKVSKTPGSLLKEAEIEAVEVTESIETPAEKENDAISDVPILSPSQPSPNPCEARIEYSFAGVVLLNALPRLLTSSLVSSFFSTPTLSFAFYKPVSLRSSSWLTASDFANLSFSSHELPFKKFYGLTFPDSESHLETLSTKSTSSKESSLESVCESW